MNLGDINPAQVSQIKFQLAGDMTATVALVLKNGTLEVVSGVPITEAKAFQTLVEAQPTDSASEINHIEDEPGPPISQSPCQLCGHVHTTEGNITCICAFCYELRELVHSGACKACAKQRFGHYFDQLGTPMEDVGPQKPPWEN